MLQNVYDFNYTLLFKLNLLFLCLWIPQTLPYGHLVHIFTRYIQELTLLLVFILFFLLWLQIMPTETLLFHYNGIHCKIETNIHKP